jgi:hypothetical protein
VTARYTFQGLHEGQPLQTQANIKGVDGKRTDVVSVTGSVMRRPDLTVSQIQAPSTVRPGDAFNVQAIISELNGHVGANANCKMFVDGAQVDEARGIFVDAGSAVTCLFTLQFDVPASHTLRVTVDGVTPGDWDTANNGGDAVVSVVTPAIPLFTYSVAASSMVGSASHLEEGWVRRIDGGYFLNSDFSNAYTVVGEQQGLLLDVQSSKRLRFPITHVEASYRTNDITRGALSTDDLAAWTDGSWGDDETGYQVRADWQNGAVVWVESYFGPGYESGHVQYWHVANDYVYWSRGAEERYYGYVGGETFGYSWSYVAPEERIVVGQFAPFGDSVTASLRLLDAHGLSIEITPTIATPLRIDNTDAPYTCTDYVWDYGPDTNGAQRVCMETHNRLTIRDGATTGVSNP